MAKVFKYNEKWQTFFGSNIKPEPWMHIVASVYKSDNDMQVTRTTGKLVVQYAIFVWDTREVLEAAKVDVNNGIGFVVLEKNQPRAKDNGTKLVGLPTDLDINKWTLYK